MTYRKKLIEVALPLEAINKESAREKSIRHGHPSTLHLWWARRPLAAARAVIFSSLVDDPSSHPEEFSTEEEQSAERQRLFALIEDLVKWENVNNEALLDQAKAEIRKSTDGNPPALLDPFAGGGSIPLEAQRLGLEAHASDLNPVAVMINKAMIEIPPKFAGQAPVNPKSRKEYGSNRAWRGAVGLAEDVRYYGEWMKQEAFKRIGHLYPKVQMPNTKELGGARPQLLLGFGHAQSHRQILLQKVPMCLLRPLLCFQPEKVKKLGQKLCLTHPLKTVGDSKSRLVTCHSRKRRPKSLAPRQVKQRIFYAF